MKSKIIVNTAIAALIIVGIVIGINIALRPDQAADVPEAVVPEAVVPEPTKTQMPAQNIQKPPYESYLADFLAESGYSFSQKEVNGFIYYELLDAANNPAGFVLPGVGQGWAGPMFMFVKTDTAGVIRLVHVWQHSETPIYVVDLDSFLYTFAGFKAGEELEWQSDIHGLTGATLTAEAVIAAVHDIGQNAMANGIFTVR